MREQRKYNCWETDQQGSPTGQEKVLIAPNARWAAEHLKTTLNGKMKFPTSRCTTVVLENGNHWYVLKA